MVKKKDAANMEAKWESKLPTGWKDGAESMTEDELKKNLVQAEAAIESTEKDRETDAKLKAAKDDVKLLSSGYKEVLDVEKAKIKCIVSILQNRGVI